MQDTLLEGLKATLVRALSLLMPAAFILLYKLSCNFFLQTCKEFNFLPTNLKKAIMKLTVALLLSLTTIVVACKKESVQETSKTMVEPTPLFEEITTLSNYTFYQGDSSIVPSSPQSAHNAFFRVRFNAIAAAALTDNGKLPVNGTFPEGSIIVKDLYNSQTGNVVLYSVLKKDSSSMNSTNGWLWVEYEANGNMIYKITNKGNGCVSCHSTNHRDNVRLFDLF